MKTTGVSERDNMNKCSENIITNSPEYVKSARVLCFDLEPRIEMSQLYSRDPALSGPISSADSWFKTKLAKLAIITELTD